MESMTGYSSIEKAADQFTYSIELKSLNTKYLETYINLPRILRSEESEIDALLKKKFGRGKLELSIEIYDWNIARPVHINRDVLKKYYKEIEKAATELKIKEPFSIDALLPLDGIIQKDRAVLSKRTLADIYSSLMAIINKNISMRRKEGNALARDIRNSLAAISGNLSKIEHLSKDVARTLYQRLKNNIESITESKIDDSRLYSEIALLADKQDINEEVVRMKDHMRKFKQIMNENDQVGKRLDFLAQELFREINTIASKSNNSEISHLVVDIKNHIDKIREQCRNIV